MRMSVTTTSIGSQARMLHGLGSAAGESHRVLPPMAVQGGSDPRKHRGLVVDEEDHRLFGNRLPRLPGCDICPTAFDSGGDPFAGTWTSTLIGPARGAARSKRWFLPLLDLERDSSTVLLDNHVVGEGQALAGSLTGLLGGEERLEDPVPNPGRYPTAVVGDPDFQALVDRPCRDHDPAQLAGVGKTSADGVGGVDHKIEQDLPQITLLAHDLRIGTGLELDLGHVFVLAASHREGGFDDPVDVGRSQGVIGRMGELFRALTMEETRSTPSRVRAIAFGSSSRTKPMSMASSSSSMAERGGPTLDSGANSRNGR